MTLHLTITDPRLDKQLRRLQRLTRCLSEPRVLLAVLQIKEGLAEGGDVSMAAEAWAELSRDDEQALWVAWTKGGIFTTAERERIHVDPEFREVVRHCRTSEVET